MPILFELLIVVVALAGFFVAGYIYYHKQTETKLICPLNADCEAVVHSRYSTFRGVPLENIGMLYYALITLSYLVFIFYPPLLTTYVSLLLLVISGASFLFSLRLLYIQILVIKEWCTWCIASSLFSLIIFLAAMGLYLL